MSIQELNPYNVTDDFSDLICRSRDYILNGDNLLKILSLIEFSILLFITLIVIMVSTAKGYELSIYEVYPYYFWLLMVSIFLIPMLYSFHKILNSTIQDFWKLFKYIWVPPLMAFLVLFWLPVFRGYPIYGRGDTMSHLGHIKDILAQAGVPAGNGYPSTHLLVAELTQITGIEPNVFVIALPGFFILFYIFWTTKLGELIFENNSAVMVIFILSLFVGFERVQQFSPFNLSLYVLPLFFYVYLSKNRFGYKVILAAIVISLPYLHIFVGILLFIAFFVFTYSIKITKFISKYGSYDTFSTSGNNMQNGERNILLLMLVMLGGWAIERYVNAIRSGLSSILIGKGTTVISKQLNLLSLANLDYLQFLQLIWAYRTEFIFFYLFPLLLAAILLTKSSIRDRLSLSVVSFGSIYLVFAGLTIAFMFTTSKTGFSYGRTIRFVVFSSIMIIPALLFKNNTSKVKKPPIKNILIVLFIILLFITASTIFTIHRSPITLQPNSQVTDMELSSNAWLHENSAKHGEPHIRTNTMNLMRFSDALYGVHSTNRWALRASGMIPDEFGYKNYGSIRDSLKLSKDEKAIMLFFKLTKLHYKVYFRDLWSLARSYSNSSINKLNNDPTANSIYSNGENSIWLIR